MIRRVSVAGNRLPVNVFTILRWRIRRKWRVGQRGRPRRSGSSLGIVVVVALERVLFENRHVSEWTEGSEVHVSLQVLIYSTPTSCPAFTKHKQETDGVVVRDTPSAGFTKLLGAGCV